MHTLPKVLVVEDDRSIANALAQVFQTSYHTSVATTGHTAIYKADTDHYDIILLDLNLPDISGASVCRHWREGGLETPILVLSGESHSLTKVKLLDAGANDYLTKPFSLGELKARMRVLTRTSQQVTRPNGKLTVNDTELDRQTYEVKRGQVDIRLRRKEFMLLECLMEHAGTVVTRRALTRYAWQGAEDLWTNTVDVHIKHLRDKLDRPFERPYIKTVHGLGYKFEIIPAPNINPKH